MDTIIHTAININEYLDTPMSHCEYTIKYSDKSDNWYLIGGHQPAIIIPPYYLGEKTKLGYVVGIHYENSKHRWIIDIMLI